MHNTLHIEKDLHSIRFHGDWFSITKEFSTQQETVDWLCSNCYEAVAGAQYLTFTIHFPAHLPTSAVLGFAHHFQTIGHWRVLITQDHYKVVTTMGLTLRSDMLPNASG